MRYFSNSSSYFKGGMTSFSLIRARMILNMLIHPVTCLKPLSGSPILRKKRDKLNKNCSSYYCYVTDYYRLGIYLSTPWTLDSEDGLFLFHNVWGLIWEELKTGYNMMAEGWYCLKENSLICQVTDVGYCLHISQQLFKYLHVISLLIFLYVLV